MKINKLSTISFEFGPIGFITNLFNAFISEKNFLFKLLFKKNEFRKLGYVLLPVFFGFKVHPFEGKTIVKNL